MKLTGIVRNLDKLGRIVIPAEIRNNIGMKEKDFVEFFTWKEYIVLHPQQKACTFCNIYSKKSIFFRGKYICPTCFNDIKKVK